jgi:hypothetical protein
MQKGVCCLSVCKKETEVIRWQTDYTDKTDLPMYVGGTIKGMLATEIIT